MGMKLFHRHRWEVIGAQMMVSKFVGKNPRDVTEVLLRCQCGKLDTGQLVGHWSLDDIRARP